MKEPQTQNEIFKKLPQTLQILNVCGFELSTYTFCHGHCNVSSTLDIKLLVDALMERKNLHTLIISISNVEDMKILTQLTFLINLHIILDDSLVLSDGSMDKSIMLRMVNQLQYFPHLESFTLTVAEYSCHLSDYDKPMILSVIFDISPARDIQICLSWFGAQALPQFMEITARHKFGIRYYRIQYLHLLEQRYNIIGANRYQKYVDISMYNDWDDGFMAYDYKDYCDLDNICWILLIGMIDGIDKLHNIEVIIIILNLKLTWTNIFMAAWSISGVHIHVATLQIGCIVGQPTLGAFWSASRQLPRHIKVHVHVYSHVLTLTAQILGRCFVMLGCTTDILGVNYLFFLNFTSEPAILHTLLYTSTLPATDTHSMV